MKYGGIYGFVPLCDTGETGLVNAKEQGKYALAKGTPNVTLVSDAKSGVEMIGWLVR